MLSHQNGYKRSQAKHRLWDRVMARKRSSRKGQVLKEAFYKGQRTSEREHQSVVWLHADMDDQDKSIICVDTLVCCLSTVRV